MFRVATFTFALTTAPLWALELPQPAQITGEKLETALTKPLPISAAVDGTSDMLTASGQVSHKAYKVRNAELSSLDLATIVRAQFEAQGFEEAFSCATSACGGYDFRYQLALLPEPQMHVNLSDFQYILFTHTDGHVAAVVTSRAPDAGYVHVSRVTPEGMPDIQLAAPQEPVVEEEDIYETASAFTAVAMQDLLERRGQVTLEDLQFESGAASLSEGDYASLAALADLLNENSTLRVTFVGHTDAVGSLEANTDLSQKRADTVRQTLIDVFSVNPEQLEAVGIGYLSPRASNLSPEGRAQNRRVVAVLTTTL